MIKLKSIYLLMHYKDLMEMLLICNIYRLKEKKILLMVLFIHLYINVNK